MCRLVGGVLAEIIKFVCRDVGGQSAEVASKQRENSDISGASVKRVERLARSLGYNNASARSPAPSARRRFIQISSESGEQVAAVLKPLPDTINLLGRKQTQRQEVAPLFLVLFLSLSNRLETEIETETETRKRIGRDH